MASSHFTYEYQGMSGLTPTPVRPTSEATLKAIDAIYKNTHPFSPCLISPNLEAEAKAACPPAIARIWEAPEHTLVRSNVHQTALTTSNPLPEDEDGFAQSLITTLQSMADSLLRLQTAKTIADANITVTLQEQDSVSPSPEDSMRTTPQRQTSDSPPTPSPPPPLHTMPASSTGQNRVAGRRAIGRALVSARDRVPDEKWLDGIEEMRERGESVGFFYEILSLGLEGKGEVRDV